MPRDLSETRQLFDRWAATYADDMRSAPGILSGYEDSLRLAAETVPIADGARFLDIGIGTGAFAALLENHSPHITGIDISPRMLEQCAAMHPDYQLQEAGFLNIPAEPEAFDGVISSFAFHEVPLERRPEALREVVRVMKPNSVLCLLDIMFASPSAVEEARTRLGRRWDPDEVYALVGDLDEMLRAAGLGGIEWRQTAPCHWFVIARRPAPPG